MAKNASTGIVATKGPRNSGSPLLPRSAYECHTITSIAKTGGGS